jgi:hypothetical protein
MVLFRTAYTLGIEPFFFSHASNENAQQTYATITKYFVILDHSFVFCCIFSRFIKTTIGAKSSY